MQKLLTVIFIMGLIGVKAQNPAILLWGSEENTTFYPAYNGGEGAMRQFIKKNIKPVGMGDDVTVTCKVVIDSVGKVVDVSLSTYKGKVENKAVYVAEAIRVLKLMPNWKPGTESGKHKQMYMLVPIRFKDYIQ